jgi:hypothetical protein
MNDIVDVYMCCVVGWKEGDEEWVDESEERRERKKEKRKKKGKGKNEGGSRKKKKGDEKTVHCQRTQEGQCNGPSVEVELIEQYCTVEVRVCSGGAFGASKRGVGRGKTTK